MEIKNFFVYSLSMLGMIVVMAPGSHQQEPLYKISDKNQFPSLNIQIDDTTLQDLTSAMKDWALVHGMCTQSSKHPSPDTVAFASFTVFPTAFPRLEYEKAIKIQPTMSLLYYKLANDLDFLKSSLKDILETDAFTKRMFEIYETVHKEGLTQEYSLTVFRSDYLLEKENGIKQVEVNTSSVGGAGWCNLYQMHRCVNSGAVNNKVSLHPSESLPSMEEYIDRIAKELYL